MATAQKTLSKKDVEERAISFIPFGETEPINLTMAMVRSSIANPTKSGKLPSDQDLTQFLMICKSRRLNPWTGDVYLIGYDSQNGPNFSIVVAVQTLFKRAEMNPEFDGIESGVIVRPKVKKGDADLVYREGDFVAADEVLEGGWCKVYRKDRSRPTYDALNLKTYDKGNQQWKKDPAGMIVKCSEGSALRKAFPSDISGLYFEDEMHRDAIQTTATTVTVAPKTISDLTDAVSGNGNDSGSSGDQGDNGSHGTTVPDELAAVRPASNESPEKYVNRIIDELMDGKHDPFDVLEAAAMLKKQGFLDDSHMGKINSKIDLTDSPSE